MNNEKRSKTIVKPMHYIKKKYLFNCILPIDLLSHDLLTYFKMHPYL